MRKALPLLALAGTVLISACSETTGSSGTPQFSRQITFPDLKNTLQGLPVNGAARVRIELPSTGLIARQVKVQDPQDVNSPERVESRITGLVLSAAGDQGTLTLEPGFPVSFTQDTKFAADEATLTFQQFLDRVDAALASNPKVLLAVEADRLPANPLVVGPGDPFPATQLVLKDEVGGPELHINITSANLIEAGAADCSVAQLGAPPLGCLRLLGLTVGLDNTTELEAMLPDVVEARFEGIVDCTTLIVTGAHTGSFSLVNEIGTIEILTTTRVEFESGDDEKLADLAAVQTACEANPPQTVRAEGEGVPGMTAGTIEATEAEFEVEEQEDAQEAVEFKGLVSVVDLDHRTVTVAGENGTVVVHVAVDGLIDPESDLTTLQAVSTAIAAVPPQQVEAEGHAAVGSAGTLEALDVRFRVEH
jgi:hypothetical protein